MCSKYHIVYLNHHPYESHFLNPPFCFSRVFHPSFPLILVTQSSFCRPSACTTANGYRLALMVT